MTRFQNAFGALLLAQCAHSAEEYVSRLWESFPPARFVSGLLSEDLERGFLVANVLLVTFGLWCWLWPVRRGCRLRCRLRGLNGVAAPGLVRPRYTVGLTLGTSTRKPSCPIPTLPGGGGRSLGPAEAGQLAAAISKAWPSASATPGPEVGKDRR